MVALVMVATMTGACGGGSKVDEEGLVAALAAEAAADEGSPTGGDPTAARCFATAVVDNLGAGRLDELGMTPDNIPSFDELALTEDERSGVSDALFGCIDVRATMATGLTEQLGEDLAVCVAYNLSEETLRASVPGPAPADAADELEGVLDQCQSAIDEEAG